RQWFWRIRLAEWFDRLLADASRPTTAPARNPLPRLAHPGQQGRRRTTQTVSCRSSAHPTCRVQAHRRGRALGQPTMSRPCEPDDCPLPEALTSAACDLAYWEHGSTAFCTQ